MAHKKGQGSTKNGRSSNPKYLGIKLYEGEVAHPGSVLIRQRGTKIRPGFLVKQGSDDTLYSVGNGKVMFLGDTIHVNPTDPKEPRPFWLVKPAKVASN
jgi:large subunit ribosomal protein L27